MFIFVILHTSRNGKLHLCDFSQGKGHHLLLEELKWKALGVMSTLSTSPHHPPIRCAMSYPWYLSLPSVEKWVKTGLWNLGKTSMSMGLECVSNGSIYPTGPQHQLVWENLIVYTHTYYVYIFCLTSRCYRDCLNHLEVIWNNFTHSVNNVGYFIPHKILLKRILTYRETLSTKIIINNKNTAYRWYNHSAYYGPRPANNLYISWFTVHKSIMR